VSGWAVAAAAFLIAANGFFVWAEFALVAARRTRIEALAAQGNRRAKVALRSMSDLNFVLGGAQLGITMASLALGFVAEPAIADALHGPLSGLPDSLAHALEVAIALTVVVAAHMVLGEMVPKNLAIAEPDRSALWIAVPFRVTTMILRPLIASLNAVANGVLRLFGIEPRSELVAAHSAEEIAGMLEASRAEGVIGSVDHGLLSRALNIQRLDAQAVMVPRPDAVALPVETPVNELWRVIIDTGHSRIPLYRGTLDDVAGFVHVKDLLSVPVDDLDDPLPPSLVREMLVVPESRALLDVLADMRRDRKHFAVVVDEHGGTAGIVTLEDVLEELVGEIWDEYDVSRGRIWRLGPRRSLVDAGLRPDELERHLDIDIPEGDFETLGGFVMAELGKVPAVADEVDVDGWTVRVRRMDGRRVDLLEVIEPPDEENGDREANPAPGG